MEWREACLRPALYLILHEYRHHPGNDSSSPRLCDTDPDNATTYRRLHHHAQSCLDLCAAIIRTSLGPSRHGGTWFTMRYTFRSAMQIVASARYNSFLHLRNLEMASRSDGISQPQQSPLPLQWKLEFPVDEEELYSLSLGMLGKWSSEAADVNVMERVLEAAIMALRLGKEG